MSNQHQCHVRHGGGACRLTLELERSRTRVARSRVLADENVAASLPVAGASPAGTWDAGDVQRFRSQQLRPTLCLPNEGASDRVPSKFPRA